MLCDGAGSRRQQLFRSPARSPSAPPARPPAFMATASALRAAMAACSSPPSTAKPTRPGAVAESDEAAVEPGRLPPLPADRSLLAT